MLEEASHHMYACVRAQQVPYVELHREGQTTACEEGIATNGDMTTMSGAYQGTPVDLVLCARSDLHLPVTHSCSCCDYLAALVLDVEKAMAMHEIEELRSDRREGCDGEDVERLILLSVC